MAKAPSWRKIEAALEEIARSLDYRLDRDKYSDIICEIELEHRDDTTVELNLTDLAKELEQRL